MCFVSMVLQCFYIVWLILLVASRVLSLVVLQCSVTTVVRVDNINTRNVLFVLALNNDISVDVYLASQKSK